MVRESEDGQFFRCHYCGASTNARLRECCELGHLTDLKRLPSETLSGWMSHAETWLPNEERELPGTFLEDAGRLTAMLAGRLLVAADEVERLRECRNAAGAISQKAARLERSLARSERDEHAASERSNRLLKQLCDVCDVVAAAAEDSALRRQLLSMLTEGQEPVPPMAQDSLEDWKKEAERARLVGDDLTIKQATRVIALIAGFEELQQAVAAGPFEETTNGGQEAATEEIRGRH